MPDRFFFPLLALLSAMIVALAMVWPQGLGDRSWGPFGHMPVQRTPEMQARMQAMTEASERRLREARERVEKLQQQTGAPAPGAPAQ